MANRGFGFIHLSDLHFGQKGQTWLWPNVKDEFYEDLKWAYNHSGPWDLLFFTGDLVFSGKEEEFSALDSELIQLAEYIKSLQGFMPAFLPIPGNHDLQRPGKGAAELSAFPDWHSNDHIRKEFWTGRAYNQFKIDTFAEYQKWSTEWRSRWPGCMVAEWHEGLLAGEFSVRFKYSDFSLGVVGLNTAFLDLSDEFHEGMLSLEYRQLSKACNDDSSTWLKSNDVNLLLTHHPPSWFGNNDYQHEINIRRRFCLHLCGHMHIPNSEVKSRGGGSSRPLLCGASLFGLETFKDRNKGEDKHRIHGYSTGRVTFKGGTQNIRIWPRIIQSLQDGERRLGPDLSFLLDRSELSLHMVGTGEQENFGDDSEIVCTRTARFGPKATHEILSVADHSNEFDIVVAYSLDRIFRGGQLERLKANLNGRVRIIVANIGDPICRQILNRKFGYNDDELKSKFIEHLKALLGSTVKVEFDEANVPGKVQVTAQLEDSCRFEIYVTNQAITQSVYRADDTLWVLPLWMEKSKDPAPRVWEFIRHRSPKVFNDYINHFENLTKESECVFCNKK